MTATNRRRLGLFALAFLFTLLNAFKPLTVDDTALYAFAEHMSRNPLDPYGFEIFWFSELEPAFKAFTPPVFTGWWAVAVRLFGEQPVLWKLWMLPLAVAMTFSIHSLARRFARGLEIPLTAMTVLSPSFLPSVNLMLDVPWVSLGLTSLALFLYALDAPTGTVEQIEGRKRLNPVVAAALAGLVAGLAFESKYSGAVVPATLFVAACVFRRPFLGGVALACAAGVVVLIEGLLAWKYGNSLLLEGLALRGHLMGSIYTRAQQLWALFSILGGVAPAVFLLGWAGLRGRVWAVWAGIAAMAGVFLFLAGLQGTVAYSSTRTLPFLGMEETKAEVYMLNEVGFFFAGILGVGVTLAVACRLCRLPGGLPDLGREWRRHPADWFLVFWVVLEIAGYFLIAPLPGVRRVLGIVAALTLLLGRLASRTCRGRARVRLVHGIAGFGVVLGLGFFYVDWWVARAQQEGPEKAAAYIRRDHPDATIWYLGHWGFQYYADRLGMRPMIAYHSRLKLGDWLIVPDENIDSQVVRLVGEPLAFVDMLPVGLDPVPYRTLPGYYLGGTALDGRVGPRYMVTIFRVYDDFMARWPEEIFPSESPPEVKP